MEAITRTVTFKITDFAELKTLVHALDAGHDAGIFPRQIARELDDASARMSDHRCGAFMAHGFDLVLSVGALEALDDSLETWAQMFEGDPEIAGAELEKAKAVWASVEKLRGEIKASGLLPNRSDAPTPCKHPLSKIVAGVCTRCDAKFGPDPIDTTDRSPPPGAVKP